MSITYKGTVNGAWKKDIQGNISTNKTLIYLADDADSSVLVSRESEIPLLGTAHQDDITLKLTDISISPPESGDKIKKHRYSVVLTYTRTVDFSTNPIQDNTIAPWRMSPYNISVSPIEKTVPFVKAYATAGASSPTLPVINPVGDAYEAETIQQSALLRVSYNRQSFSSSWVKTYTGSVNSGSITVAGVNVPSRQGIMKALTGTYLTQPDETGALRYRFWRIDVEIEISSIEQYITEIMIRGLYFLSEGKKYRIYTDNQGNYGNIDSMGSAAVPVDEPQRLTIDGDLYTGSTAEYQEFIEKRVLGWGSLGIPSRAT